LQFVTVYNVSRWDIFYVQSVKGIPNGEQSQQAVTPGTYCIVHSICVNNRPVYKKEKIYFFKTCI